MGRWRHTKVNKALYSLSMRPGGAPVARLPGGGWQLFLLKYGVPDLDRVRFRVRVKVRLASWLAWRANAQITRKVLGIS
jgi:hypothetical protein